MFITHDSGNPPMVTRPDSQSLDFAPVAEAQVQDFGIHCARNHDMYTVVDFEA